LFTRWKIKKAQHLRRLRARPLLGCPGACAGSLGTDTGGLESACLSTPRGGLPARLAALAVLHAGGDAADNLLTSCLAFLRILCSLRTFQKPDKFLTLSGANSRNQTSAKVFRVRTRLRLLQTCS
jgi:hypothetical protein